MATTHRPKLDETVPAHPNREPLRKQQFYIILLAFHLAVFWQIKDFPFLGDSIPSNLFAVDNIYSHNFTTLWNIPAADPGHGTLYPMLIALVWAIFGKSLWITHLVQVVVGLLLCNVVFAIARNSRGDRNAMFAVLLFSISPLYVAQLTGASLQLPLTLAAFAGFYFWQKKRYAAYTAILSLMMLCHLQGAFLLLFLCLHDAVMYASQNGIKKLKSWAFSRWWVYSIPFLVFITWGVFHYVQFGWSFSSPNYLREAPSLKGFVYNLGIAAWRVIDFGYLVPVVAVFWFLIKQRKKLSLGNDKIRWVVAYILMLAVVGGGISLVFAHPPIHRYFLPSTVLLLILFTAVLEEMKPMRARVWALLAGLALVAGNFMYYPGKCIGDANLAYLPMYSLEKQIAADFPAGTGFYTYAPLSYPSSIRYLDSTHGPVMMDLYHTTPDSVTYVLQSCMNCEFTAEEKEKLKGWHGTSYEAGGIYINIYANPAHVLQKPEGWQLRQPSAAEKWLQHLKGNLR